MNRAPSIRLYLDQPLASGAKVTCNRAQTNYLCNVMRLADNSEILVFDGRTGEWRARLARSGKRECVLHVGEQERRQSGGPDVHYLFAPLKRARLDYMVQKAVELGVAALCPVMTRRTEVKRVNLDRLRANVIEAAEQCGVLRVPEIDELISLEELLAQWNPDRRMIYCDEVAPVSSPIEALRSIETGPIAVLVGPEGGFDEREQEQLRSLPFVTPVSLGPRVMRADTAAVAVLALVNSILGDWR